VQPFGNVLVRMTLTGAQIKRLLEQQWQGSRARMLQVSGLSYTWDAARVKGFDCQGCVVEVRDAGTGQLLDPGAGYGVTVNSYLADGGDEFSVLLEGTDRVGGPLDLEGLVRWMPGQPQPLRAPATGQRIKRLN
jgi:5'-nucleotidase